MTIRPDQKKESKKVRKEERKKGARITRRRQLFNQTGRNHLILETIEFSRNRGECQCQSVFGSGSNSAISRFEREIRGQGMAYDRRRGTLRGRRTNNGAATSSVQMNLSTSSRGLIDPSGLRVTGCVHAATSSSRVSSRGLGYIPIDGREGGKRRLRG